MGLDHFPRATISVNKDFCITLETPASIRVGISWYEIQL